MNKDTNNLIKETVRRLRESGTEGEKIFWEAVRNRKLNDKKFNRQFPLKFEIFGQKRFFIADFFCFEHKLVVEIDGEIHSRQKDYDEMRTHVINKLGFKVIRFLNDDVVNNLEEVLLIVRKNFRSSS